MIKEWWKKEQLFQDDYTIATFTKNAAHDLARALEKQDEQLHREQQAQEHNNE